MNIYQKKIVKEKEFFYNEDCIQTKSTFPNSKLEKITDIYSNLNIRNFYGINSKKLSKNKNMKNNNRHLRSKSQIITNDKKIDIFMPKEIKTVLIKLKTPIEQINNNNNNNKSYLFDKNYRTHYGNKFYKNKIFNINNINGINNDSKTIEMYNSNVRENDIKTNKNNSNKNNNIFYNTSKSCFYNKKNNDIIDKNNKYTRNKSVLLNNEDSVSSNVYKKSFCLDKHKNYGGNFKNKERSRSRTNPKNIHNKAFKKKDLLKNVSTPNIHSLINIEEIHNLSKGTIYIPNKNIFQYTNSNAYQNINNKNRNNKDINLSNLSTVKKINVQYDLFINQDNKKNTNSISINNDYFKEKENNIEYEICKNNEILSAKNNKVKNIPPLNFKNNLQKTSKNDIIVDSKDMICDDLFKYKYLNNTNSKIKTNKYKKNIMTFEEPLNDEYSMRSNNNLLNLVNISERETKRENINNNNVQNKDKKQIEDIINNYINKMEKNKPKIKVNKNYNKKNMQKNRNRSKGKLRKNNSTRNIDIINKRYNLNIKSENQIKSIPLKLKKQDDINTNNQNMDNKCINIPINNNKNENLSNIVFINKKDFELWNDLARIYKNNGKFQ